MLENKSSKIGAAVLAAASLLPSLDGRAFGQTTNGDKPAATAKDYPDHIVKKAEEQNIPLEALKLQGKQWVACINEPGKAEVCILLGPDASPSVVKEAAKESVVTTLTNLKNGDELLIQQYGKVAQSRKIDMPHNVVGSKVSGIGSLKKKDGVISFELKEGVEARVTVPGRKDAGTIDTIPKYIREDRNVVRTRDVELVKKYIEDHPETDFVVIVTAPSLCPPCRTLDRNLASTLEDPDLKATPVKTFLLEFFSFEEGKKAVLGERGLFPTVLSFRADRRGSQEASEIIGDKRGASEEQLSGPIRRALGIGNPDRITRGVPGRPLLIDLLRGRKQ